MENTIQTSPAANSGTKKILRYSHPFYTNVPHEQRQLIPGAGKRMTDYVATKLEQIPAPKRNPPTLTLSEIIGDNGVTEITQAGSITFHAVGDTGHPMGEKLQMVADAMSEDYDANHPETSPAFFLHLGDVIYYDNSDEGYHAQFYEPYKKYPGKIIAIPGNHDGELFKYDGTSTKQTTTLEAFQKNFCQPKPGVPEAAGTIYREMISQPGVYWLLNTPFADVIGLYSNIAEGPGYIAEQNIGQEQKNWLQATLATIKSGRETGARKALIIAVHHPPFSNGGHDSSTDMLNDIDECCNNSLITPDIVLAAHAHNYQRFTRYSTFQGKEIETPYFVAGVGGRGITPVKAQAFGIREGNLSFDKVLNDYGYLTITVTENDLTINMNHVTPAGKELFDKVIVDLKTNKLQ